MTPPREWAEEYISGVVERHNGDREDVRSIIDELDNNSAFIDHDSAR